MSYYIATVVVTYNRKKLLERCLSAISKQTVKPSDVFILDNASTDGTIDCVKEWGYYNSAKNGITFHYNQNATNEGGAGGFHLGMKAAIEHSNYDAIWVMDDDGEPEADCLEKLTLYLSNHHYIAPIVLSDEDHKKCSFAPKHLPLIDFAKSMHAHDGIIDGFSSPYNGILFSRKP